MKRSNELYSHNTLYYFKAEEHNLISRVPNELMQIVFSCLRNVDLETTCKVCKAWKNIVDKTTIRNILEIKILVQFFNQYTSHPVYPDQAIALEKLNISVKPLETLLKINFTLNKFLTLRNQFNGSLFNLLTTLLKGDIANAFEASKENPTLVYFEPIFNLVILDRELKELGSPQGEAIDANTLINVALDLTYNMAMIGNPCKSPPKRIPSKDELILYHGIISDGLEKLGTKLPIKQITRILVIHGEMKLALRYLKDIVKWNEDKDSLREYLSIILMSRGQTEMALTIASEINEFERRYHLQTIILCETQKLFEKQSPIKEITEILVRHDEIELALTYLDNIENDEDKASLCEYLSDLLIARDKPEMARRIASTQENSKV